MQELSAKLKRLGDADRVRLYRELLDRRGSPSPRSVKELVLVYENASGLNPKTFRETAWPELLEHERPTRFIATDKLPRTPNGKLDRRGLPGLIQTEQNAPDQSDRSQTYTDDALSSAIETFRSVLGTGAVGPESNFFELGGHSLLAVECILEFERKTGERISITRFLNHPTPRGIATLLKEQGRQSFDYVYPVSKSASGLPVFVFSASKLAYALKQHRPDWTIYGIQLSWRDDNDEEIAYRNLEEMATRIVAEIRQLGVTSDFVLAGSSFPSMVAFEVAKQLRATGNTPKLTILIEPSLWPGFLNWVECDLADNGHLKKGANHYLRWLLFNNPLRAQFWRRLNRLYKTGSSGAIVGDQPAGAGAAHKAYETERATALWRDYKPTIFDGPALLLAAAERDWQARRNWHPLLGGACKVHYLDTDHQKILREPFLSEEVVPLLTSELESKL